MSTSTNRGPKPVPVGGTVQGKRSGDTRRRQRRRLIIQIAVVAVAAIAGLYLVARGGGGGSTSTGGASSGPPFQVGRPGPGADAPTFTLASTAGGRFDLAAQRGKTVLLYFHEGLGCQPCWDQIRDIEKTWPQFQALGIDEMVAIAGNPLDQLRQKAADDKLTTPVLADPELSLGATYGANNYGMMGTGSYGHSFIVVGPDGMIRWRADYGGAPKYTMYVRPPLLLDALRAGLASEASRP